MKRTIKNLLKENCRVYVYLSDKTVVKIFLRNAESEGFTFADRVKTTARECDSVMAINKNFTINYVGIIGHIAFNTSEKAGDKKLLKVDYKKYISGDENYIIQHIT
ncbi:MAG: hypothetical protein PUE67_04075 [Oscillospiraceae bacterium]|nr:hypothetical protein [Oscillospiraceae bacterium]